MCLRYDHTGLCRRAPTDLNVTSGELSSDVPGDEQPANTTATAAGAAHHRQGSELQRPVPAATVAHRPFVVTPSVQYPGERRATPACRGVSRGPDRVTVQWRAISPARLFRTIQEETHG